MVLEFKYKLSHFGSVEIYAVTKTFQCSIFLSEHIGDIFYLFEKTWWNKNKFDIIHINPEKTYQVLTNSPSSLDRKHVEYSISEHILATVISELSSREFSHNNK
jgi:protein gp37